MVIIAPISPSQIANLPNENAPDESLQRLMVVTVAKTSQTNRRVNNPINAPVTKTKRSV